MNEHLRELEEEIRRDQMRDVMKRYAGFIIALCVAVVGGTTGGVIWKSYNASVGEKLTTQLLDANAIKDVAKRHEAYAVLIKDAGDRAQGALAALRLAADQKDDGKADEALATYRAVVEGGYDETFRNLARVQATHVSINSGADLKLGPVDIGKDSPYYDTLREAEAWRLLKAGEKQKAFERFSKLAEDVETPPVQRQRMNMVVSYLAPQIAEK